MKKTTVSKSDFEEFVSLLSEDDEDDRAILEVLKAAGAAYARPEVRAALEAQEQRRLIDQAVVEKAHLEGAAARLNGTADGNPGVLAEEYAKHAMAEWEKNNPTNYPEPPWDEFDRDRKVSDVQDWVRDHENRVAERYFRASGLNQRVVKSFLEGYERGQ